MAAGKEAAPITEPSTPTLFWGWGAGIAAAPHLPHPPQSLGPSASYWDGRSLPPRWVSSAAGERGSWSGPEKPAE